MTTPFDLLVRITRAHAAMARRVDRTLAAHGLSLNDLLILLHLGSAPGGRLRRVDLADRLGMTASGVTRALGPLERIGLLVREANPRDARVAYASLTPTGRTIAGEARLTAERTSDLLFTEAGSDGSDLDAMARLLESLGGHGLPESSPGAGGG